MSRKLVTLGLGSVRAKDKKDELRAAKRETKRAESKQSHRVFAVLGLMIVTVFAGGAIAAWRNSTYSGSPNATGSSSTSVAPMVAPTPVLPSNNPSKEYVYAGSALLATTEPFREAPDDLAVWRRGTVRGTSVWEIRNAQTQTITSPLGTAAVIPVPADYDGDGKTDFCVYQASSGKWHLVKSSDASSSVITLGGASHLQAVHDYDGDGKADFAVFQPSSRVWTIVRSSDNMTITPTFPLTAGTGDVPEPADFDGDGITDLAVWRSGTPGAYHVKRSSDNQVVTFDIGNTGDEPVVGDYDGDGKADYATLNKTNYNWTIQYSSINSSETIQYGAAGDIPVQGNYSDGDAKTDIAIWRPVEGSVQGKWYIRKSSDGATRNELLGQNGDTPVPAPYRRKAIR